MQVENKYLIITADDYGVTPEVSLGIRESIEKGVVTCTSVMMNYVSNEDVEKLLRLKNKHSFGIGLHINLTQGFSFVKKKEFEFLWLNDLNYIKDEMLIQQEKFISLFGEIDHINFHQHIHYDLRVLQEFLSLSEFNNIPVRYVNKIMQEILRSYKRIIPDVFVNLFPLGAKPETFKQSLDNSISTFLNSNKEVTEWMVHPGYTSIALENLAPNYAKRREIELELLTNEELLKIFEENNVILKNFKEIFNVKY